MILIVQRNKQEEDKHQNQDKPIGLLPKLISNANHLISFITDSPNVVVDSSTNKILISLDALSPLIEHKSYPNLRTIVFVNCSFIETLIKLEPQNHLTLVLLE